MSALNFSTDWDRCPDWCTHCDDSAKAPDTHPEDVAVEHRYLPDPAVGVWVYEYVRLVDGLLQRGIFIDRDEFVSADQAVEAAEALRKAAAVLERAGGRMTNDPVLLQRAGDGLLVEAQA